MKTLVILGPLPDKEGKNLGGVADFNYNLAQRIGKYFNVLVITNTALYKKIDGVKVIPVGDKKYPSVFSWVKMYSTLKKIKPDYTISSLHYSFAVVPMRNVKKIHFVHGFTGKADYGFLKRFVWNMLNRLIQHNNFIQLANSYFTKTINEKILMNPIDGVVPLGTNDIFRCSHPSKQRNIDLLFVGRILRTKGIFEIARSVKYLPKGTNVAFVGDGADLEQLKIFCAENNLNAKFLGIKKGQKLLRVYQSARVFISLNAAEPFGITYIEALLSGCKIVCPQTGGQVENLIKYPDSVCFIQNTSVKGIASAITTALSESESYKPNLENAKKYYSYDRVTKNIVDKLEEKSFND